MKTLFFLLVTVWFILAFEVIDAQTATASQASCILDGIHSIDYCLNEVD